MGPGAIVRLRDGRSYEGSVEISDLFVRCDGWRRIRHGDRVIHDSPAERCWPWSEVAEVRRTVDREPIAA